MKVLMSAYACDPSKGSEPGVGWNWAVQAARFHEVWVVTRTTNRDAIERELHETSIPNLHFVYHDLPRWARFWKRGSRGVYPYYLLWQLTGVRVARKLHQRVQFDLGHHMTFTSFRFPSFLAWTGVPYIWGPLAGGEQPPMAFYSRFGVGAGFKQLLRHMSTMFVRLDPLVRTTAARASLVLAATPASLGALPGVAAGKSEVVAPTAFDVAAYGIRANPVCHNMRMLYSGRLVYWKGMQLGVAALAELVRSQPGATLTISGSISKEKAERVALERLAERLGVSANVRFADDLTRDEALKLYGEHDLFLFPSLQDSGGTAVLEAMAAGLPVACFDIGGPSLAVTDETGVRVPAHTPRQAVLALAAALDRLAGDAALRQRMGEAGRQRIDNELSWARKGELIDDLYRSVVTGEYARTRLR